jgi:hypothetical protein
MAAQEAAPLARDKTSPRRLYAGSSLSAARRAISVPRSLVALVSVALRLTAP